MRKCSYHIYTYTILMSWVLNVCLYSSKWRWRWRGNSCFNYHIHDARCIWWLPEMAIPRRDNHPDSEPSWRSWPRGGLPVLFSTMICNWQRESSGHALMMSFSIMMKAYQVFAFHIHVMKALVITFWKSIQCIQQTKLIISFYYFSRNITLPSYDSPSPGKAWEPRLYLQARSVTMA